ANGGCLRFRCSPTLCTLRSGSRNPPFSTRPDLNLSTPWRRRSVLANQLRHECGIQLRFSFDLI
ncbi:MAG: hypothetical protein E5W86_08485, partial [Mesorhizobium sp.]